jgi:4-alpha-glucanotransferase
VLRAAMRYAGAIRLDHVMGLQRQFLIPSGMKPDRGMYVRSSLDSMLAVTAQESVANRCIVIGEDLGTVLDGFRETLADWGLWSYQVMLFERGWGGEFRKPQDYRENAIATFATHDLPTFLGWLEGRDLAVKRGLGLDPGETDEQRQAAIAALRRALSERGVDTLDLAAVTACLAATPARLLIVTMEDALGLIEQVNVPGTVTEHPNWLRRLPVPLEEMKDASALPALAAVMSGAGRQAG